MSDVLRNCLTRIQVARSESDEVDGCHRHIAECIARGEAQAAEDAMRQHLLDLKPLYDRAARWTPVPARSETADHGPAGIEP